MAVSEQTYERLALEEPDRKWERWCDGLREKPGMTMEHGRVARRLGWRLRQQLDEDAYEVDPGHARLRVPDGPSYLPDVCVIPRALVERHGVERPRRLEVYDDPLPLVVEVWSPTTGDYDIAVKLHDYQRRGDAEVWRLHPYDKTLTAWLKQPDGRYAEATYRAGAMRPIALPGVVIDVAELFAGIG